VEAAVEDHDLEAIIIPIAVIPAHQLERRLIGFRSGVAEEHTLGKGVCAEPLCELDGRRCMVEVRAVPQRVRLLLESGHDARMAVP
jgi:hypothetical protein